MTFTRGFAARDRCAGTDVEGPGSGMGSDVGNGASRLGVPKVKASPSSSSTIIAEASAASAEADPGCGASTSIAASTREPAAVFLFAGEARDLPLVAGRNDNSSGEEEDARGAGGIFRPRVRGIEGFRGEDVEASPTAARPRFVLGISGTERLRVRVLDTSSASASASISEGRFPGGRPRFGRFDGEGSASAAAEERRRLLRVVVVMTGSSSSMIERTSFSESAFAAGEGEEGISIISSGSSVFFAFFRPAEGVKGCALQNDRTETYEVAQTERTPHRQRTRVCSGSRAHPCSRGSRRTL